MKNDCVRVYLDTGLLLFAPSLHVRCVSLICNTACAAAQHFPKLVEHSVLPLNRARHAPITVFNANPLRFLLPDVHFSHELRIRAYKHVI